MNGKGGSDVAAPAGKVVVVAVKGSKEIRKSGLVWALTHVAQPGDCIKLLVVIPAQSPSKKIWGFSRFATDCTTGHKWSQTGTKLDQKDDISDLCSEMMFQLQNAYDPEKVRIRLKVVSASVSGVVATEAKKVQSSWVILDGHLKHERKCCMEELQCNLVVMKRSGPEVLRLNLNGSPQMETEVPALEPFDTEAFSKEVYSFQDELYIKGPSVTPASSPEHESSSLTPTDVGTSSMSSSDPGASPYFANGIFGNSKKGHSFIGEESSNESDYDTDSDKIAPPFTRLYFQPWLDDTLSSSGELTKGLVEGSERPNDTTITSMYKSLLDNLSKLNQQPDIEVPKGRVDLNLSKSVREVISLSKNAPPGPPPLCSLCQHKAPAFGTPPKWFTYAELEAATDGFSKQNFLAEGGYGSVHRGVLTNGQVVAVKQHKLASSQGDVEFCSEVEVLSCAQHRNVVTLIGFCVEDGRRLLVYEYICNGSLDLHLFGRDRNLLGWSARQKIAVGAARGLRYLHEECRVGCIVHRDMRPNNILITHDFEPLVGDFGLARWQPDGDMGVETRIIGTFGYLAPEYAQSGQITEKADVYSFGVVLVELVTGRKAIDITRAKGQQCLTEWARPLLRKNALQELLDPCLRDNHSEKEVSNMLQCASLCIQRDPCARPRMSQVLRMLEGDIVLNSTSDM
ncbi:hypothetical protein Tsubulata_010603 [Turnera subulata]|uniref:Protein kinase domain-containing protein n=1 Tax=Turnera subulata TaxID=218843 RepID=A0A9Q0F5R5_9ROSI|nr:hypothetical protein Tsubulata_010603 [Turnera subulata]